MARWEPNARGRLATAALELYSERGFEQTTVAEIAQRAGLTERTFFRHYADKREVLFAGAPAMRELFVQAVADAPRSAALVDVLLAGFDAVCEMFAGRREVARRRQSVITANAHLQERELIKLARLSAALTEALHRRGVTEPTATLTAEAGIVVFKVGFERWIAPDEQREMPQLMRETLDELRALATGNQ